MLILECAEPHKRAAKTFASSDGAWTKISDYDAGTWFAVDRYHPKSLADIAILLELLRSLPEHFVVRGELSASGRQLVGSGRRIRRCHTTRTVPNPAIEDAPQQWLMFDVDHFSVPVGFRLGSEDLIRRAIQDLLPAEFHDVACAWSLSSSSGLTTPDLKCHLWFWLEEPVSSAMMHETLRHVAPGVDIGVCSPSQPHYTADPLLIGAADPYGQCRAGLLSGAPSVRKLTLYSPPICVPVANLGGIEVAPIGNEIITANMIQNVLSKPKGEGRRLWTLLFGAAAHYRRQGWKLAADDLARAARIAHPTFDRRGVEREAQRAIDAAAARIPIMNAKEIAVEKLRWQLSQPLTRRE